MTYYDTVSADNPTHYWEGPRGGSVATMKDWGSAPQPQIQFLATNTGYAAQWDGGLSLLCTGSSRMTTDTVVSMVAPITLEAWVWLFNPPAAFQTIMACDGVTANSPSLSCDASQKPRFIASSVTILGSTPLSLHAWHHLVGTYTAGGAGQLFVDTVSVGTGSGGGALPNNQVVTLGELANNTLGFKGYLGSPAIYNYVLIGAQIAAHFNAATDRTLFPEYVGTPAGGFTNGPPAGSIDMSKINRILNAVEKTFPTT